MASNWTFRSAQSGSGSGATAAITTGTVKPNVGDLMVVSAINNSATTANTALAISDSSSGGAAWILIQSVLAGNGKLIGAAWYKVANAADANGGSGITITTTASGGTGTQLSRSECDIFGLPSNLTFLDLNGSAVSNSGSSISTLSCTSSDQKYWTNDALYVLALGTGLTNGGLVGSTVGIHSLALTGIGNPTLLANTITETTSHPVSGGSIVYTDSWTTNRTNALIIGASFVYTAVDTSGLLPNILARPQ